MREEREQLVRCLEAEKQLFGETRLIHEALEKKDGAEVDSGGLEFEGYAQKGNITVDLK